MRLNGWGAAALGRFVSLAVRGSHAHMFARRPALRHLDGQRMNRRLQMQHAPFDTYYAAQTNPAILCSVPQFHYV